MWWIIFGVLSLILLGEWLGRRRRQVRRRYYRGLCPYCNNISALSQAGTRWRCVICKRTFRASDVPAPARPHRPVKPPPVTEQPSDL
jgi:hypothetical protein